MICVTLKWRFNKFIQGIIISFNGHAFGLCRIGKDFFPVINEYDTDLTYFKR